jgi:serine/threonine protein kinase
MEPTIFPATVLAERFQIIQVAGSGGMGTVYQARELHTDKWVALKVLHHVANPAIGRQRFLREAQLLAELQHPGAAAYVASGQTEQGHSYLAMEWLDGETLEERLRRGPLPVGDCLKLLLRIAAVLARVHELGIVHRDIKPRSAAAEADRAANDPRRRPAPGCARTGRRTASCRPVVDPRETAQDSLA